MTVVGHRSMSCAARNVLKNKENTHGDQLSAFKRGDIQLRKNPFTFDFNSVLTPNLFRDPEPGTKKVAFQFNMS